MSLITNIETNNNRFAFFAGRMRILYATHPEWWAWFFSLLAWALLFIGLFTPAHSSGPWASVIYCSHAGAFQVGGHTALELQGILHQSIVQRLLTALSSGIVPWLVMVAAMMFPLLNEPLRHVAFSVRRKDKNAAVLMFLIGYTIIWTIAGALLLLLPFALDVVVGDQGHFVNGLIKASGFLLAAILIWQPARLIRMTKCAQTIPIRINGWQLKIDSLSYGLKMGVACLKMCWAPMVALMLAHHHLLLMYEVTVVIFCERYLLPHTSKLPGYAWGIIALTLFGMEILA